MPVIRTRRADIVWNYVGTIVSMSSGFILLPLLMRFLSGSELGLWYVYIALSNMAMLFEFGFNPTFARNIVYVVSGARRLTASGHDPSSYEEGVDWHLLNVVIKTSKLIYGVIGCVVVLLLASVGTVYISFITVGMDGTTRWTSWIIFCVATFLNFYFLYSITVLRGYGDVAGENMASTFAKLAQLVVSAVLLIAGYGLIGASIGYLVNALLMRLFAVARMHKHVAIERGRASDQTRVTATEMKTVTATISHLAWRDGLVQIALYASTQAMSILSSLFLGLVQTGTYSVLLQLATAVYNFASTYPKSFFPAMQSAYAGEDVSRQRKIVSTGITAYWGLFILGTAGVAAVILPLLPLIKHGVVVDYGLFLAMCLYLALLQQHSIFCNYIISMNEVPYMPGYLVASILGTALVWLFCGVFHMGAWGIVLGQALSQIVYNNWKWPVYLCEKIGTTYHEMIQKGASYWLHRLPIV